MAWIIPLAFVLCVAGGVALLLLIPKREKKPEMKPAPLVNVEVLRIDPQTVTDSLVLQATVEPNRVVTVSSEVDGRVEKINCVEGRPCKAGEPMVALNTDLLKAAFDSAKAQRDLDAFELERITKLQEREGATDFELKRGRAKLAGSQAVLDAAKAHLDRATIYSPVGGILNRLPVEMGEYVKVGMPVAEIVDVETVRVVADVPERDVRYLQLGQSQDVLPDFQNNPAPLKGTVDYIAALADPSARTTRVEILVDNLTRALRSGQFVRVRLKRRSVPGAIMVPLSAVISGEQTKVVYVVEDGKAQARDVELGFFQGYHVQIVSGLKKDDLLIVKGQWYVAPNQSVKVVEPVREGAETQPAAEGSATRPQSNPRRS